MAEAVRKIDIDEIERRLSNLEFTPSPINFEKIKQNYVSEIGTGRIILKLKASADIGLGHLSRMITLGWILKEAGAEILFAINDFEYAKEKLKIEGFRFEVNRFDSDEVFVDFLIEKYNPDVLIVDEKKQYSLRDIKRWQQHARFISLDFIGEGYEICDKIIMPNAHFEPEKYPTFNNIAWGWNWILINKEMFRLKPKSELPTKINKIIITTGGSDPSGMLFNFLELLKGCEREVLILVGDAFKHKERLDSLNLPENFKVSSYHPSKLLEGDIALATFGITVYELIYLNVPFMCVGHTEENERGCDLLSLKLNGVLSGKISGNN